MTFCGEGLILFLVLSLSLPLFFTYIVDLYFLLIDFVEFMNCYELFTITIYTTTTTTTTTITILLPMKSHLLSKLLKI